MTPRFNYKKPKKSKSFNLPDSTETRSRNYEESRPVFYLHNIRKGYCVKDCEKDDQAQFAKTLKTLSEKTWKQLRLAPRHGVGYEKVDRGSIKESTVDITEDVKFIAFRFSGKKPMVGYRDAIDRNVFHILWLDRAFTLYNHGS